MKLILSSRGFTTNDIANKVSELVGKPLQEINIAIINEAYTALRWNTSKDWMIKELSRVI